MKTADFFFDLPPHLIAQHPPAQRGQSRLMVLDRATGKRTHRMVEDLPEILCGPEFRGKDGKLPLLVFNDSKVRKARLIGKSLQTGANVEFLLLGIRDQGSGTRGCDSDYDSTSELAPDISDNNPRSPIPSPRSLTWKAMVQRSKRRKTGSTYAFYDDKGAEVARATIVGGEGEFRFIEFDRPVDDDWLDRYGHIPLPPYIRRDDSHEDADRYQTVYAAAAGSAAAPTAGLHFTRELLDRLAAAGIETAFITLHVGLGTFLPVRSENIEDHVMHEESFFINEETAVKIEKAKAEGRKIIAVGTTSVRTLESAWNNSIPSPRSPVPADSAAGDPLLLPGPHSTSIFIYPGYQFKAVDHLFTNFHTPESTLLMLVSAFADDNTSAKNGRELILESYAEAVREGYRFFSYGDAMLVV